MERNFAYAYFNPDSQPIPIKTVGVSRIYTDIQAWCQTWKLPLNTSKCNALRFVLAQHQDSYQYTLDNAKIQFTEVQRDLGVIVKDELSWSNHYNHICSKAYHCLNLIHRAITTNSPINLEKQLYISLVRS